MPFLRDVAQTIAGLAHNDPIRLTLEFLLQNAVGSANARPKDQILAHLQANGVAMSEEEWQHAVLQPTRTGTIFISSSQRGYYLIDVRDNYVVMRDWYLNRIHAEVLNLANLRRQARNEGWRP